MTDKIKLHISEIMPDKNSVDSAPPNTRLPWLEGRILVYSSTARSSLQTIVERWKTNRTTVSVSVDLHS